MSYVTCLIHPCELCVVNNNKEFIGFNVRRFHKLYKRQQEFFFSVRERAVSSKSYILIGSGSGQNFPISDHGHSNCAKTIE